MKHKQKILVLAGGSSNESAISEQSGFNVSAELQNVGFTVLKADPSDDGFDLAISVNDIDLVIPMLHGQGGEDGTLQTQLDEMDIPYIGSMPDACKLSYDKARCKQVFAQHGILTPNWQVVDHSQFQISGLRESSYVLKPISGGSSIDTLLVYNPDHQSVDPVYIRSLFSKYKKMLIEELIEGQEITVAMHNDTALPVLQIIPPEGEEFNFENKYNGLSTETPNPSAIDIKKQNEAQDIAVRMHQIIGCRDFSRSDMIIAENGAIYALEINTIPGMTKNSLYPKALQAAGISVADFLEQLVLKGISR